MGDGALSLTRCHLISSFTGELCQGNQHLVFVDYVTNSPHLYLTESLYSERYSRISIALAPYIVVFLHIASNGERASARFFHHGYEVLRCGSGTIAAAHVLQNILSSNSSRLPISCLQTRSGDVRIGCRNSTLFYETQVLPLHICERDAVKKAICRQQRAWSAVINRPIKTVALVGGKSDYCILELYNKKAVKQCTIHVPQLTRFSARAVIVTAVSEHWKNDYVMRYFTPQYGQYEDKATGSANAMLAAYWQEKLAKTKIRGQQLSQAGGLLWVEKCGNRQRVFGEITMHALPAAIINKIMTEVT